MKSKPHSPPGMQPADPAPGNPSARSGRTQPLITTQGKPKTNSAPRYRTVASAAYYCAERCGFGEASELVDWLESRL